MTLTPLWLRNLLPAKTSVNKAERVRSCVGAMLGILLTGTLSVTVLGSASGATWLIAPIGASALLLFAVPASPMAQPWSIIGGNVIAAVIGVTCAKFIAAPVVAAAIAITLAMAAMFALRCLHPPSGAVALIAVLGDAQIRASGYGFVISPVALNTALLLVTALLYNNLVGRRYPHSQRLEFQHPHRTADLVPINRLGFTPDDLQAVLRDYNQVIDVSIDDLEALFHRTEMQAFRRRFGERQCGDIMSKDILAVEYATELAEAWGIMEKHSVQALPVIDRARRVIGIVSRSDFLAHADPQRYEGLGERLRALLHRTQHSHSDKHEAVGQIMNTLVKTAPESSQIVELVPLMVDVGLHHVPIVNDRRQLVGMVTQTDLIAALYETSLTELNSAAGFDETDSNIEASKNNSL